MSESSPSADENQNLFSREVSVKLRKGWARALVGLFILVFIAAACAPEETEPVLGPPTPEEAVETPVAPDVDETPDPSTPEVVETPATPDVDETPMVPEPELTPDTEEIPVTGPEAPFEPVIGLELVAEGFAAPVALIPVPDGSGRMFVADQVGIIYVLTEEGERLDEPFLDLSDRMIELREGFDERGLLGLALHPEYEQNGRFFVYYSAPLRDEGPSGWDHTSHISEFMVSEDDENLADLESERIILQVDQPQFNHNAGQIAFGPDGYLYIPLGDGGGANDTGEGHPPLGHGQDISTLLGSILRIDVDGQEPYGIPEDNPLVGEEGEDEIWAYGLRNPYMISFDAGGDRELFAADAGQDLWEAVYIVERGGNYGWNIKEGSHCFNPDEPQEIPDECPDTGPHGEPLIDPVIEYPHLNQEDGIGLVVVGGFVYRGEALEGFEGRYIFGDWSTSFTEGDGQLLVASPPENDGEMWEVEELDIVDQDELGAFLLSFGQDESNELYVLTSESPFPGGESGRIYRIVPAE
jgi:glucose/arabinose dehydrogenase